LNKTFLITPSDKSKVWVSGTTIIPNTPYPITSTTKYIPEQDAWDIAYGKDTLALLWGYAEYSDIFGEFYTIRYCDWFTFTIIIIGWQLAIDSPHAFAAECTERKQEHRK
jgi:hypothetical protein